MIDFLQDSFKSYQRLLQNLVPMVLSEVDDNRNKHWECFVLVSLEDVQKVVIFKEAHRSVSNLEMDSTNTFDDSLEKLEDARFNLVYFANLQHLL